MNFVTRRPEPLWPTLAAMAAYFVLQVLEVLGVINDPDTLWDALLVIATAAGVALPMAARNRVTPLADPRLSDGTALVASE